MKKRCSRVPPAEKVVKRHHWKRQARKSDEYKKNRAAAIERADGRSELRPWLPKCKLTAHHLYNCKNEKEYSECDTLKMVSWYEHNFLETLVGRNREESAQKLRTVGEALLEWAEEIYPR